MSFSASSNTAATNSVNTDTATSASEPSLVGAHLKYAKGAVEDMLGMEGASTIESTAREEMKAAAAADSPNEPAAPSTVLGSVERTLGKAAGCEGIDHDAATTTASSASSAKKVAHQGSDDFAVVGAAGGEDDKSVERQV